MKIEYKIVPRESLTVIRGCSGCGGKTHFINTKKFRVNANGSKIDVWLIYQCERCRHTLNLAIYERQKVSTIPEKEYRSFLENDEQLAERYGRDVQLFRRNRAKIDPERLVYEYNTYETALRTCSTEHTRGMQKGVLDSDLREGTEVVVHNPYGLKIRPEKQIAEILGLSRNQVKRLMEQGEIEPEESLPQMISFRVHEKLMTFYKDEQ